MNAESLKKFNLLKLNEKKTIICSVIGCMSIDTLNSLRLTLKPIIMQRKNENKEIIKHKNNEAISNEIKEVNWLEIAGELVEDVLSNSVQLINDEYLKEKSFYEFTLPNVAFEGVKSNQNTVEHIHISVHFQLSNNPSKKKLSSEIGNNYLKLIKQFCSLTEINERERLAVIESILFSQSADIQTHIADCVVIRLQEKWTPSEMPLNILYRIYEYLDPSSICSCAVVCKQWTKAAHNQLLWMRKFHLYGRQLGFPNIIEIMTKEISKPEDQINWFQIFRTLYRSKQRKMVKPTPQYKFECNQNTRLSSLNRPIEVSSMKLNLKEYESKRRTSLPKLDKKRDSLTTRSARNPISSLATSRKPSMVASSRLYTDIDPDNDSRQLMRPILGRLKQFQISDEVAIDYKPTKLKSLSDYSKQAEAKVNVKLMETQLPANKSAQGLTKKPLKKIQNLTSCSKLTGHLQGVTCVRFDERRLVSSSLDGTIRLWDPSNGRSMRKLQGHKGGVYSTAFHGNLLISGGWDMSVIVWSLDCDFSVLHHLYGHTNTVTHVDITSQFILSCSLDGSMRLYKRSTADLAHTINFHGYNNDLIGIVCAHLEKLGQFIATGHCDRSIRITDLYSIKTLTKCNYQTDVIRSIYFESQLCVTGGHAGHLQFWEVKPTAIHQFSAKAHITIVSDKQQQPLSVECIAYHCHSLWTGHEDGSIKEWYLGTMTSMRTLYGHKDPIKSLTGSGNILISGSSDYAIRLWIFESDKANEYSNYTDRRFNKQKIYKENLSVLSIMK